jgi:hypothetical protein
MTVVLKIRVPSAICVAAVRVSSRDTFTRRFREQQAKRRNLPIEQCGRRAFYLIDGKPLCMAHAGQRAITILLGETHDR